LREEPSVRTAPLLSLSRRERVGVRGNLGQGIDIRSVPRFMPITLDDLRRFAVARTFFKPTTLKRAVHKMGFVQADPIRAPARAQDLTLRHRVKDYVAGDLERRYQQLGIEEDFFVTY